jgi:hypothetical protein
MKIGLNRNLSEGNIYDSEQKYSNLVNERKKYNQKNESLFPDTVKTLQHSIHEISQKIEEDKINLRIIKERYTKKQNEFNKLSGKPATKTKEQLMQEVKTKIQKYKNRQIFDPNYGKKEHIPLPDEETFLIKKNTSKSKLQLDFLRDEINKHILSNLKLSNAIKEVRKDKLRLTEKFERIEEENKEIEKNLALVELKNKKIFNRIHFKDLNDVREKGRVIETQFLEERDNLENRFHKVIEANIRREKEHKNDLRKIRLKNAIFADKARNKGMNNSMMTNGLTMEDSDEMYDRIPVLDTLINKWKYITKYKKTMINKYIKHAHDIRISFDKLLKYLGLENLSDLPDIIDKDQKQVTEIEIYLSKLNTQVDELKEKKLNLEKKIVMLNNSKKNDKLEQTNLVGEIKEKTEIIKKKNDRLEQNINRKRNIFRLMQKPTFDFLRKMQQTYLTDFVVSRHNVEDNEKLNETNVVNFLETMYCYCQLIKDFDENAKSNINLTEISKESRDINKTLDLLKKDFKMKLSKINYNNCVNNNVQHSIYTVVKKGNDFDETIRRLANEIVEQVNKDTSKSFANISSLNTNNITA